MPRFDAKYYGRFYGKNGAHDRARIDHLAAGVHNMAAWWGVEVRTMFDVGAGMGMWRDWYAENHPDVKVRSIDVSEHACRTWGHENRNIAEWSPDKKYDLVVCHSVLQYLDNQEVVCAIDTLGDCTRHLMYLELPTKGDFDNIVDPRGTDLQVHQRSAVWYRRHLNRHFTQIGAGLWTPLNGLLMYELEASR